MASLGLDRVRHWWSNFRTFSVPSAQFYDSLAGKLLGRLYDRVTEDFREVPTTSILDAGCGPGWLALRLAASYPNSSITGIDISPEMVALAKSHAEEAGLGDRVRFQVADVGSLPFGDGEFDLVVSTLSLHHWPDHHAGIREIHRVLQPAGEARIYDVPDWFARIETSGPGLHSLALSGPFREARVERFYGLGPFALVLRLTLRCTA